MEISVWFCGGVGGHMLSCTGVRELAVCCAVGCEEEWEEKKAECAC